MGSYSNLAAAYRQSLIDLLHDGRTVPSVKEATSPASGFGAADRPSIELLGYAFEVTNPFACLVDSEARPLRLGYCVGSLLWTLAGSNDLVHLQGYHPDAKNFSDDGISLSGAFGRRLFRNQGNIDQIQAIADRLRVDPASRRTYAAICDAEDNVRQSREYPCCIGLQYFLRDGELHSITYMRAQHALLVLPYDAFLFMALHCLLAARIGASVGSYRHICGTFHVYESERSYAERVIGAPLHSVEFGRPNGNETELAEVIRFEERARASGVAGDSRMLLKMLPTAEDGSEFARYSKLVLLAHWIHSIDRSGKNVALEKLPDEMQTILRRQWGSSRAASLQTQ